MSKVKMSLMPFLLREGIVDAEDGDEFVKKTGADTDRAVRVLDRMEISLERAMSLIEDGCEVLIANKVISDKELSDLVGEYVSGDQIEEWNPAGFSAFYETWFVDLKDTVSREYAFIYLCVLLTSDLSVMVGRDRQPIKEVGFDEATNALRRLAAKRGFVSERVPISLTVKGETFSSLI